jgi:hypothetical protein
MFRVFLLSPAHCGGRRAQFLLNGRGRFPLAERFRNGDAVTIGETFSFLSGLYFRGKLTYAARYNRPPADQSGVLVITANQGMVPADSPITLRQLKSFGTVDIDSANARYRRPLERDLVRLGALPDTEIILLGSVATGKYVDILLGALQERLLFPVDFVGRGDMSRGALLLRSAREGQELEYRPAAGAIRHGRRAQRVGAS